ncbi:short chain dehydrogenase [Marimonas sp. MJW-29]|uniref:Short chain dehydrogenase n=1 Tax=Sulfitobacter sediminis TaxID=3234186 RepID=A0ABV3RM86_9RHOB
MRIIVVGAGGDIGQAACKELQQRHEIVTVGRSTGDYQVDVSDLGAVKSMHEAVSTFDAVVSCAGDATFAPLADLTHEAFMVGLRQKVMGQVNLVLAGLDRISDGGSFTLTSGVLDRDQIRMGSNAATANGALAGFVKSAAIEMPRGLRVNVVSPGMLDVSAPRYGAWFHGHKTGPILRCRVGICEMRGRRSDRASCHRGLMVASWNRAFGQQQRVGARSRRCGIGNSRSE